MDPVWVKRHLKSNWMPGTITSKNEPLSYTVDISRKNHSQHENHLRTRSYEYETNTSLSTENEDRTETNNTNIEMEHSQIPMSENPTNVEHNTRPKLIQQEPRHIMRDHFYYYK